MKNTVTITVDIEETDNINWALKKFRRQCESYGVIKEYRKRQAYKKPSVKLKEKREAAAKRKKKESSRRFRYSKI